jgi:hypothetical protein
VVGKYGEGSRRHQENFHSNKGRLMFKKLFSSILEAIEAIKKHRSDRTLKGR